MSCQSWGINLLKFNSSGTSFIYTFVFIFTFVFLTGNCLLVFAVQMESTCHKRLLYKEDQPLTM